MVLGILGVGTAQPVYSIEQSQAVEFAAAIGRVPPEDARVLEILYRRTAVERRSSAVAGRRARELVAANVLCAIDQRP